MDGRIVCRVMLYSYAALVEKCEVIDKHIYNTAVRSAFKNTVETYKEIERLTSEKIAYINVKVIIDQAMGALKRAYELEQHHLKGKTIEQIATALNTKDKTVARRIDRQRAKLYEVMLNHHSAEDLLDIIYDSEWLMNKYKREIKAQKQG